MPSFRNGSLKLHCEQWGARADPPALLLHGLSCQIIHWPLAFIGGLAYAGCRVITMDNRWLGGRSARHVAARRHFQYVASELARVSGWR